MSKFISVHDAAIQLNTSVNSIWVTACTFRKKTGEYPLWYKSSNKMSYVNIKPLLKMRDSDILISNECIELYYFITEEMKMKQSHLANELIKQSELFTGKSSWLSFMYRSLFVEPQMRFNDRVTRLHEFHRIATQIKKEHENV